MKTYVIDFAATNAALASPQLDIMVNTISIMIRYSSISTKAFLNLPKLKFLHRVIVTPSARIPAQQLNANVSTNASTNPFVGISHPKAYDKHEIATSRMFSIVSRIAYAVIVSPLHVICVGVQINVSSPNDIASPLNVTFP